MKEVCRAIITDSQGRVLLGKRQHGIGANLYALIGGKPNENESIKDAVIREVKEEIGLDFNPILFLEEFDSISVPGETWLVTYFTGTASGDVKLKEDEVVDIVYISENELDSIQIAFDHKEILDNYFKSK